MTENLSKSKSAEFYGNPASLSMNVFVYGTLLVPRIWETVTNCKDVESDAGFLYAHRIYRVKDGDFPGIVATGNEEDRVRGRIFYDVPEDALQRLDDYEDGFYDRLSLTIEKENGESATAEIYVVPESKAAAILSDESWTIEWFETVAFERYWNRLFLTREEG